MTTSVSPHRGLVIVSQLADGVQSLAIAGAGDAGALLESPLQGLEGVGRLHVLCGALFVLLEPILGVANKQFVDRLDEAGASAVLSRVLDGQT